MLWTGSWIMVDGPELKWTEGDRWHANVSLPSGSIYEYKYVLLDSTGMHALSWQRGNNSVLAVKQVWCLPANVIVALHEHGHQVIQMKVMH